MINSDASTSDHDAGEQRDAALGTILQSSATGGLVLAGLATAVVVGIWLLFYLLVFLPRAAGP
jgi:hypothetical protein